MNDQQHQQQYLLSSNYNNDDALERLDKLHAMIQIEKELTKSIELVQPYLLSSYRTMKHTATTTTNTNASSSSNSDVTIPSNVIQLLQELDHPKYKGQIQQQQQRRVRPIPTNIQQVQSILCIGRHYSNKTSAPPCWTTTTPLIHFSTPNPLPHQLRSSILANVQLQQIIIKEKEQQQKQQLEQQQQQRKRKLEEEEEEQQQQRQKQRNTTTTTTVNDSKTRPQQQQQQRKPSQPKQPAAIMNMNLSDDDDDDSDDDDESE